MSKTESTTLLSGHSGALIQLIEGEDCTFVRKQASRPESSYRLQEQYKKHLNHWEQNKNTPEIYGCGLADNCFYYDMEYIVGQSVGRYIATGHSTQLEYISSQITEQIQTNWRMHDSMISEETFTAKIREVRDRSLKNPTCNPLRHNIINISNYLLSSNWNNIHKSPDHGDFTLENMIITVNAELKFIDFDTTSFPSTIMDIGKLFQDLRGYWYKRSDTTISTNEYLNLSYIEKAVLKVIDDLDLPIKNRIDQIAIFHLFRILPYCISTPVARYVCSRCDQLIMP